MTVDSVLAVSNLDNINNISFKADPLTKQVGIKEAGTFDDVFQSVMNTLQEVNDYQISAENLQLDYASGKTDDMLAVMVAQEKAYYALNFTVQITNKIVEAYKEIMRMQV